MNRRVAVVGAVAAWAAYAMSWLLPTVRIGAKDVGLGVSAGWKAFQMSLEYVVKPDRLDWVWALCIAGVLANVPVLLSPLMLRRPAPRWLIASLLVAFVVNLAWIPFMNRSALVEGYWLWIGAIAVLAAVAIYSREA